MLVIFPVAHPCNRFGLIMHASKNSKPWTPFSFFWFYCCCIFIFEFQCLILVPLDSLRKIGQFRFLRFLISWKIEEVMIFWSFGEKHVLNIQFRPVFLPLCDLTIEFWDEIIASSCSLDFSMQFASLVCWKRLRNEWVMIVGSFDNKLKQFSSQLQQFI